MYYSTNYSSPLGEMLFVSDGESICGIWFCGQKYFKNNIDAVKKVCSVLKEDVFAYSSLKEAGIVLKKCGFKKVYTDNNNITKWRFEYGK